MYLDQERYIETREYFNQAATNWEQYRKKRAYYWNSVTANIGYFIQDGNSILEIGCGNGDLLGNIRGSRKVGIDYSEKLIALAREKFSEIEFHVMEAEKIALHEKFDVIILSNVIGYFQDIEHVFLELGKLSHQKTRIIVTYYNKLWEPLIKLSEFLGIKRKSPEQNWLTNHDIMNLLYLAGFESYRHNKNMLIPFNIPLLSPFLNKFLSRIWFFNILSLNRYVFARPFQKIRTKKEMDTLYSTSIVIPARNESGNIEHALERMPKFGKDLEIIFIEGHSSDDTWETIQKVQAQYKDTFNIKIGRQEGKGKGDAVRKGYDLATGDILMILDADLTVPPEELPKFYYALVSGKGEFINGSRLIYPMEKRAMRTLNSFGNKFFSWVFSWLLEQPVKDSLCGTKVMFKRDYENLKRNRKFFGEFDPFGDFDLLFGAYKLNLKIIDLPIRYRERLYGDTNISRFSHGFLLLRMAGYAAFKIKFW